MSERVDAVSDGPVAIVTGGGSGIGRAVCVLLARAGLRLVICGRRAELLEETREQLGEGAVCEAVVCDVGDPLQAAGLVDVAVDRFGRVDVVINNAAMAPLTPIDAHTVELIAQTYMTNAVGPASLIAAAWKVFRAQHGERRASRLGACVVNVSTMGTRDPFPGFFAYAASKAATNLMVKSCAKEGKEIGVRAFAVAPGAVETPMLRGLFGPEVLPTSACLRPERVAEEIVACVLGERDQHNGRVIFMSAAEGVSVG